MHYKYSYILVVVFVTFTFGVGLPILFPIGFMSISLLYVTERLMIVYSYRRPIMFSTKTNRRAYSLMLTAPIMYCIFGALMFSNQQVFRNNIDAQEDTYVFPSTNHTLDQLWNDPTPGTLYFIALFVFCAAQGVRWLYRKVSKYDPNAKINAIQ